MAEKNKAVPASYLLIEKEGKVPVKETFKRLILMYGGVHTSPNLN
jgi:hypothetical protein